MRGHISMKCSGIDLNGLLILGTNYYAILDVLSLRGIDGLHLTGFSFNVRISPGE